MEKKQTEHLSKVVLKKLHLEAWHLKLQVAKYQGEANHKTLSRSKSGRLLMEKGNLTYPHYPSIKSTKTTVKIHTEVAKYPTDKNSL